MEREASSPELLDGGRRESIKSRASMTRAGGPRAQISARAAQSRSTARQHRPRGRARRTLARSLHRAATPHRAPSARRAGAIAGASSYAALGLLKENMLATAAKRAVEPKVRRALRAELDRAI
jgi:hypothetical protein